MKVLDWNDFRCLGGCVAPRREANGRYRTLFRVTLRLHDTASRSVRAFQPITPGQVSVYVCGATVQSVPHIGHMRSAICFDILIRWLETSGYHVIYCRNVTDIEDKILRVAKAEAIPWWALAERNQRAFSRDYDVLGCRPPDVEPRATGHIPEMVALISRLIDGGQAYAAGGDVYFDVRTAKGYGSLSGQRLADMRPADDTDGLASKRDPRDFALWKGAKPGEPFWETPWGPGRPGWHLECSAMSTHYLGPEFDIHGGGFDLLFPHHKTSARSQMPRKILCQVLDAQRPGGDVRREDEQIPGQRPARGRPADRARPQELRYYLAQTHYRSALEYSPEALEEAAAAYQRIERFVTRAQQALGAIAAAGSPRQGDSSEPRLPISFADAMDNDLAVPAALAAVHAVVRDGDYALTRADTESVAGCLTQVRAMLSVLGLDPLAPHGRPVTRPTGCTVRSSPRRTRGARVAAAGSGTRARRLCFGRLH